MPLITCPDCSAQVSDQAPACIQCGRPMGAASSPPAESKSSSGQSTAPAPVVVHQAQTAVFCHRCGGGMSVVGTRQTENPLYSLFRIGGCLVTLVGLLLTLGLAIIPGGAVLGILVLIVGIIFAFAGNKKSKLLFACTACGAQREI